MSGKETVLRLDITEDFWVPLLGQKYSQKDQHFANLLAAALLETISEKEPSLFVIGKRHQIKGHLLTSSQGRKILVTDNFLATLTPDQGGIETILPRVPIGEISWEE